MLSHVPLFVTPWTIACQAPLSMEFSRQEYWSGLPFPSPGDLPDPGVEPRSLTLQADSLPSEPPGKPFSGINDLILLLFSPLCRTLCDPMDCRPPGSSVHRILQARILEWVAISTFRGSSLPRHQIWVFCIAGRFFTI